MKTVLEIYYIVIWFKNFKDYLIVNLFESNTFSYFVNNLFGELSQREDGSG